MINKYSSLTYVSEEFIFAQNNELPFVFPLPRIP